MRRLLPLLVPIAACAGPADDPVGAGADEVVAERVVESTALPIAEVSGLGQRRIGGAVEHLAAGDASRTIVTFRVEPSGRTTALAEHDLSGLFAGGASQWEAIAGDGDGRVFLLEEAGSRIEVLAPELDRVVHTIHLVVPPDHPLAARWSAEPNSRGEGIVLLANGHVLVAKEKSPPALIEFVPRGEAPAGYDPDHALGARPFPLASGAASELVAAKHWLLKSKDEAAFPDLSDLATDGEGRLLLLTDEGRAIARIERRLDTGEERIDIKATFGLPGSLDKPEGLVFAAGSPFVATDAADVERTALHRITPLP
jgi:hypothetical protein